LKKILSILFLLHLCFGLLIPSITVLCFNTIEESIDWFASESDNEVEEKNEDTKTIEFFVAVNLSVIQDSNSLIYSLHKNYKSIHLRLFKPPPEV